MITERWHKAGETRLNYASTEGNAPPLVLLHGTANMWQAFQLLIPELSTRWKVYAPDFRGHGSSMHTEEYGFGYYVEDTVHFLRHAVVEPAVLFGHSLGGRVATKIAAEYPDLVRGLILGDSSLKEPVPSDRMRSAFGGLIKVIEEQKTTQNIYKALKEADPDGFNPTYGMYRAKSLSKLDPNLLRSIIDNGLDLDSPGNHFHGYHPMEHIKHIKCPVLILQAEHGMLSEQEVENALDTLPEAYHVVLRDAPHEFLTRPSEPLLRALQSFLEAIRD
ncbi:alpha/beta hydrolase [archaeon]|nr:alpha/beta hydrolase [archaeon]